MEAEQSVTGSLAAKVKVQEICHHKNKLGTTDQALSTTGRRADGMRRRRGDQRSEVGGQKSEYGAELTVSLSVIRYLLYGKQ
jgi:hypothetical protein